MVSKKMELIVYRQNHTRPEWLVDLRSDVYQLFFIELADDLSRFGIELKWTNSDTVIEINSYADILNSVRISSPSDDLAGICIGHVIGKSPRLDLMEDIKRAVNRIAFAPETIAPDEHNRQVCHNCGCGC